MLETVFPQNEGAQYWFMPAAGEARLVVRGLASRKPAIPVTAATTFHCFSTTKVLTALAVMQLVSEGKVSLDTPLETILPEIPYRNGCTVRQVSSHQAGLPNPIPLSWVHAHDQHASFDAESFYRRVLRDHPRASSPGRRARYSNVGFLLLGRVVQALEGRPYEEVIRTKVLGAVGLPAADPNAYLDFAIPLERHAVGYARRWSMLGMFISLLPDEARLQSIEEGQIRFRPFHLDGSAYGGLMGNTLGWAPLLAAFARRDTRLLPPAAWATFFEPQALATGAPSGHAIGWFTGQLGRHRYVCHAGGGPGYYGEVRVYTELGAASAVFSNTTSVTDQRLLDRLDRDALG